MLATSAGHKKGLHERPIALKNALVCCMQVDSLLMVSLRHIHVRRAQGLSARGWCALDCVRFCHHSVSVFQAHFRLPTAVLSSALLDVLFGKAHRGGRGSDADLLPRGPETTAVKATAMLVWL